MQHFNYNSGPGVITGSENNKDLFIRRTEFSKGYSETNFHHHPNTFEFYLVLKGKLVFATEKEELAANTYSLIYFEEGEPHKIREVTEDCEMLLIKKIGSEKASL